MDLFGNGIMLLLTVCSLGGEGGPAGCKEFELTPVQYVFDVTTGQLRTAPRPFDNMTECNHSSLPLTALWARDNLLNYEAKRFKTRCVTREDYQRELRFYRTEM